MLILLVGTGIYLTFLLKGLQFRSLFHSLYLALIKRKESGAAEGDITHFQALMTALAATVGTGNIAGVATTIRCIPLENKAEKGKCLLCGSDSEERVVIAKAY